MEGGVLWCILDTVQAMYASFLRFLAVGSAVTSVVAQNLNAAGVTTPGLASANGVYNTSFTPSSLPWNTYNYCNAPHVNAAHYNRPVTRLDEELELVFVNAVIRHHKVGFILSFAWNTIT